MIVFCMLFLFSESWNWTMMLSWHPDHPPSSPHRPITSIQVSKLLYKRATLHTRPLTGPKGCVHGPRAFGTFPSDKSCRAPRATVLQPQTTSYAAATLNAPFCPNVAPSAHQEVHGGSNCQSSECHVYWSLVLKVYNARPMMRLQFATSFHEGMADLFLIHAHLENNTGTVKLDTAGTLAPASQLSDPCGHGTTVALNARAKSTNIWGLTLPESWSLPSHCHCHDVFCS